VLLILIATSIVLCRSRYFTVCHLAWLIQRRLYFERVDPDFGIDPTADSDKKIGSYDLGTNYELSKTERLGLSKLRHFRRLLLARIDSVQIIVTEKAATGLTVGQALANTTNPLAGITIDAED
jgi:hypothetical protein